MSDKHYIRILPDLFTLYQYGEGFCSCAHGDEVSNEQPELEPMFSIIVPGLEEWCRRYEDATDFADTVTDPSFDWRSWHFEGLQFAKAIWQQLPRNYSLFYWPPFEDNSGIIENLMVDENIDTLIERLGPNSSYCNTKPAMQYDVAFTATRNGESVIVHLKVGRAKIDLNIPFTNLEKVKNWLEDIADSVWNSDRAINSMRLSEYHMIFYKQTVGIHQEMGQFRINQGLGEENVFSVYVNIVDFIKGFYLAVMNALGFGIYPISLRTGDAYPTGEVLKQLWHPYNIFKSVKIEPIISDMQMSLFATVNTEPINETFVMFPEYGGCIFWDTMGVGSGSYDELFAECGDIKINVPGLKEWSEFYDNPDDNILFDDYWRQGWQLALQVRGQLPDNIDLYYMCYDPSHPTDIVGYNCQLLKIIVPRT